MSHSADHERGISYPELRGDLAHPQSHDGVLAQTAVEPIFVLVILLAVTAMYSALFARAASEDVKWRHEAIFYPVSVPVYIIMTVATFGLYTTFWLFKNWQWLRSVERHNIWPMWRTLLLPFNAALLFMHIGRYGDAPKNWFSQVAIPLGVLILVFSFLNAAYEQVAPGPYFVVQALLIVPAIRIAQLNMRRRDIIRQYSRFGWRKITCLVFGAVFWALIALGSLIQQS